MEELAWTRICGQFEIRGQLYEATQSAKVDNGSTIRTGTRACLLSATKVTDNRLCDISFPRKSNGGILLRFNGNGKSLDHYILCFICLV